MIRKVIPLGTYTDCRPDGKTYASAIFDNATQQMLRIDTDAGIVALNPGDWCQFLVINQGFGPMEIAGVGHGAVIERDATTHTWEDVANPAYGINPAIYDDLDTLWLGAPQYGSQGFRYAEGSHVITGDETANAATPLAQALGVTGLSEWTARGDIFVGQGNAGGCVAQLGSSRWILEPGAPYFIKFYRGEHGMMAVCMWKPQEHCAVVLWFTEVELLNGKFPVEAAPTPKPEPEPTPAPPTPDPIPDPTPDPSPLPPTPLPTEPLMIAYGPAFTNFTAADSLVDNGNGTVSVKKRNGKYLCITPEGHVEERDTPGGAWESFFLGASGLIALRDLNGVDATYVLPLVR